MKRRNDPTSALVSNILGSYDKVKELVTSSHMIGAILQPATPRPSKDTFEAPAAPPPLSTTKSRSNHKRAKNGLRPELSRQGVFEQFQQSSAVKSSVASDVISRQSADQVDAVVSVSSDNTVDSSRRSGHITNGRHSSSDSKHSRPKLCIPSPKVSSVYHCTCEH